ncbi:MetQ/NlpA family ABC transporter substrate-binding protein [Demequina gelatinilytica]|uniref:MetQ/NlpA family ABC transporter substrate-binding protein n=1 Tax=Demequina gelatinilytica TaxID=1638980 RepID=UPI000780378B|nr:MetQ/NlpA family ABC transporter substrate-binding protein [Demequina gelatinilytica]
MRLTRTPLVTAAVAGIATLGLAGCGADSASDQADAAASDGLITVTVGASPVPHAQILEFIDENLAAEAGIDLDIVEFDDYVLPNEALDSGELDANYFQHLPYLESQIADKGYEFEHGEGVHIEPYAAFSTQHDAIEDLPDGATIAITNDVANQLRGLRLLDSAGLLNGVTDESSAINLTDEQNPHGFVFVENQPEVIVQQIEDPAIDLAFVNGNFILQAGLNTDDALLVETVEGNPNANLLVWRADTTNEGVAILEDLLHSDEVTDFITETWPSGDVLPGA